MKSRVLVGTRKGTFFVEKEGGSWRPKLVGHRGQGVNFVARDPNGEAVWAALGHGHWGAKLSHSSDGGATWTDATQITYPEDAYYLSPPPPDEDGDGAGSAVVVKPATLLKLWALAFSGPGEIYAGTVPGGLFVSRDDGESFELCRPLWDHHSRGGVISPDTKGGMTHWFGTPAAADTGEFAPGLHSIVVDPRDPLRVLVAVSTAGVLETSDGGKSWRGRNRGMTNDYLPDPEAEWGHDPHYVTLCQGDPDKIWQQNHCGVFFSRDGAETWKKVSAPDTGVHFGFPIAVDQSQGETAWVVPGKADSERTTLDGSLFVARTEDGGETWRQLRNGLPQEHAYDVVYRHALDAHEDLVAFGSTTGNLYLSEDRGDSWLSLASNLPPIYSVRFG